MPAAKDYYQILGVSESASIDQIKKAYRDLAKKHHPDVNQGNKSAEEKFKEISQAYYVLSDTQKRREYDTFKKSGFSSAGSGQSSGFQGAQGFDYEDILRQFKSAQNGQGRRNTTRGFSFGGGGGFEDIFSEMFGAGRPQSAGRAPAGHQTEDEFPSDTSATLKIPKSRAQKGGEVSFGTNEGKKITVKIPAGIESGKKLRLSRQGHDCPTCHHPGDLILTIKVE